MAPPSRAFLCWIWSPASQWRSCCAFWPFPLSTSFCLATGHWRTRADLDDQRTHHVYGLWDGAPASHNTWLDQSFTELPPTTDGQRWRRGSTLTPNWSSTSASRIGHLGWRLALPAGERLVGDRPLLADGLFTFSSTNPSQKSDPGAPPGQNWLNQVQVMTGGAPPRAIWDTNADGAVDPNDHIEAQVIRPRPPTPASSTHCHLLPAPPLSPSSGACRQTRSPLRIGGRTAARHGRA